MRIWLAEFIGTFALVFVGVGTIASGLSPVGVALAFGFVVAAMISAVGPVSAAHFNPAVTVGFYAMRRITLPQLFLYWSAELSGAVVAMLHKRLMSGAGLRSAFLNLEMSERLVNGANNVSTRQAHIAFTQLS